jgi:ERCC4-type nuclease
MKVPVSWLRDFVDVPVSPEELGEALTLRGFELSAIERANLVDLAQVLGISAETAKKIYEFFHEQVGH